MAIGIGGFAKIVSVVVVVAMVVGSGGEEALTAFVDLSASFLWRFRAKAASC